MRTTQRFALPRLSIMSRVQRFQINSMKLEKRSPVKFLSIQVYLKNSGAVRMAKEVKTKFGQSPGSVIQRKDPFDFL